MVKTLMLKVCEYNNLNVKFGFVPLDLVSGRTFYILLRKAKDYKIILGKDYVE